MVKRKWWGVPYKGSKSQIVDRLVDAIPYKSVDNFYDLFAGGCAVTHKMLLEGRYKHCYANDIDGRALRLFRDGMDGKYVLETRWVSREDFFKLKDTTHTSPAAGASATISVITCTRKPLSRTRRRVIML